MKKFYLSWSLVLLVAFSFNLYAQDGVSTCATEEINQEYFRNNPKARERQTSSRLYGKMLYLIWVKVNFIP